MSDWSEADSKQFRRLADVIVPRRSEMLAGMVSALPFNRNESFRVVELSSGDGVLAQALLEAFPSASIVALERSELMRAAAAPNLARYGDRFRQRPFQIETLDWWDVMFGADAVVSSLATHHLNAAKKQYLYKAAADRLSARGVFLAADLIQPLHPTTTALAAEQWDAAAESASRTQSRAAAYEEFTRSRWNHFRTPDEMDQPDAIFHHLVWLKHAGFAAVDCVWLLAGHAVFGGYKSMESAAGRITWAHALEIVDNVIRSRRSPAEERG